MKKGSYNLMHVYVNMVYMIIFNFYEISFKHFCYFSPQVVIIDEYVNFVW
jgi:hypothetical protein